MVNVSLGVRASALAAGAIAAVLSLGWAPFSEARVTRIVIDATGTLAGQDIPYQTITGRHRRSRVVQDKEEKRSH